MGSNSNRPVLTKTAMKRWTLGRLLLIRLSLMASARSMAIISTNNRKIVFSKMKSQNNRNRKALLGIVKIKGINTLSNKYMIRIDN